MGQQIKFFLDLTVDNEELLRMAAYDRAREEEWPNPEHFLKDRDLTDCVQMLLDPGTLAGCSILESRAEIY